MRRGMVRKHKFRAWGQYASMRQEKMVYNWQDSEYLEHLGFNGGDCFELMQYTGLKDKNGKEIYEGDIVDGDNYVGRAVIKFGTHLTSTDYYADNAYGFYGENIDGTENTYSATYLDRSEVIGNVWENPELLKQ